MARLILDTGAIISFTRSNALVAEAIRRARNQGDEVVVTPGVVAQSVRGGPRNAPIHHVLRAASVPPIDLALARRAGELLGVTGTDDAIDALVVAEALRHVPSVILTSDPDDMALLAGLAPVRVIRV